MSEAEEKLAHLVEQEKALEQSFIQSVGENNKFKEFLLKVQCTIRLAYRGDTIIAVQNRLLVIDCEHEVECMCTIVNFSLCT